MTTVNELLACELLTAEQAFNTQRGVSKYDEALRDAELEELRRERAEQADVDYTSLIFAMADGAEVDNNTGESILSRAGKTVEQFRDDFRTIISLRRARADNIARFEEAARQIRSAGP